MEIIKKGCYKGTRIIVGNKKSQYLDQCKFLLREVGIQIEMPIIHPATTFENKVGVENNNLMFNLTDHGNRDLCLAPEYTAIIQNLAKTTYKDKKDLTLFYIQECFRGEKPQKGRYRQFTQLGVEIINPTSDRTEDLIGAAHMLLQGWTTKAEFIVNKKAKRGLDYYTEGQGFEIKCPELGAQEQIVGGGAYDGGIGFAIGIDRLMLLPNE